MERECWSDASITQASISTNNSLKTKICSTESLGRFETLRTITLVAKKTAEWHFFAFFVLEITMAKTNLKNLLDFSCPTCPVSVDGSSRFNCQSAACKNLYTYPPSRIFCIASICHGESRYPLLPTTHQKQGRWPCFWWRLRPGGTLNSHEKIQHRYMVQGKYCS